MYNALDYPQLADKSFNIYPATRDKYLYRWHGGNFQNETIGKPLNPLVPEDFLSHDQNKYCFCISY